MKAFLTLILLVVGITYSKAQDPYGIPLSELKELMENNPTIYDSLYQAMFKGDSMQASSFFTLYYGAAYKSNYSPYAQSIETSALTDEMDKDSFNKATKLGETLIQEKGLNLKTILYTAYSYQKLGDSLRADKYYDIYYNLLAIPFHSGDGKSAKTAYVVSAIQDEYLILDELDADFSGQALISKNGSSYDVMSATIAGKKVDLYFNIDQPFGIGLAGKLKDSGKSKKKKKRNK